MLELEGLFGIRRINITVAMRRLIIALSSLACIGWLATCATITSLPPPDDGPRTHLVQVVSNGWHTAIVIPRRKLISTGLLPEANDFPGASFLEFGWGDREYYPAKDATLGMALAAALVPTPAVTHMAALARAPGLTYPGSEVVPVPLTESGFRYLVGAIAGEFKRPKGARAEPLSRGLYPHSNFYEAHGTFHLFNTCNTWTARMLRAGGVKLSPTGIITADELMSRLRAALDEN
jgi:uncharacterized protein (TIGR02117 family)